jgi:flagellar L-ring protein precursor FlgH
MRKILTFLFILTFPILSFSQEEFSGVISPKNSFYADVRAKNVGDLITVLIVEKTKATHKAETKTKKESDLDAGPGKELLKFLKGWTFSTKDDFSGGGKTLRSGQLEARITCKIVEILPNGNFKIEGKQELKINRETQKIILTGIIRPIDISSNNTILSNYVADAKIIYEGSGILARKNKLGIISRILDKLGL